VQYAVVMQGERGDRSWREVLTSRLGSGEERDIAHGSLCTAAQTVRRGSRGITDS
jgi:hypothetical protein